MAAVSASALGGIAALAALSGAPASSSSPVALSAEEVAKQFCLSIPLEAQAEPQVAPDREFSVRVPKEVKADGSTSPSLAASKGDVVELTVSSQLAGAVGVHGLSAIQAVHPGESVVIRFRAIYTGRFPLHFHGTDGAHVELMALETNAPIGTAPKN